jgi:hypothetical protein
MSRGKSLCRLVAGFLGPGWSAVVSADVGRPTAPNGFRALLARGASLGAAASVVLWAASAAAENYQEQRVQAVLERLDLTVAAKPEGRRIAFVKIVQDDVFVGSEIWPLWLNDFHTLTKRRVIVRELLFEAGAEYDQDLVSETARNLRGMQIFSLVDIVPVQVHAPGEDGDHDGAAVHEVADATEVGIVVHTRDMWSIQLQPALSISSQINELSLVLTQSNLAGLDDRVSLGYTLVPDQQTFYQQFDARRIFNGSWSLQEQGGPIFNRSFSELEGGYGQLQIGEPFYNLEQTYAWMLSGSYQKEVARDLQNGATISYVPPGSDVTTSRVWDQRTAGAAWNGYLRTGELFKHTINAGVDYRQLWAKPTAESQVPDAYVNDFETNVMPPQRRDIGPQLQYNFFSSDYRVYFNVDTYGQSEDVRLGPALSVGVRTPLEAFGSNNDSVVMGASAGYSIDPANSLITIGAEASSRYTEGEFIDQLLQIEARGASPEIGFFRLVARGQLAMRQHDTWNTLVALGSANGLRGYSSQAFYVIGGNEALFNFELRTKPIEWQALQFGFVAFYDVGSVFSDFDNMRFHQGAGLGINVLFPQYASYPYNFDYGVALDEPFEFNPQPSVTTGDYLPITSEAGAVDYGMSVPDAHMPDPSSPNP